MVDGRTAISPGSWSFNNQLITMNQQRILQPVLPRQEFFTKEIRRLLRGGDPISDFRFPIYATATNSAR